MSDPRKLRAIVVGGTGAVGSELVGQLLSNARWEKVISIARRSQEIPKAYATTADATKLDARVVPDLVTGLEAAVAEVGGGVDALFYAAGTTRSAAGSASEFTRIEKGLASGAVGGARAALPPVPHFLLVSSVGANPKGFKLPLLGSMQPFLYPRIKGEIEELVLAAGFDYTSIFRPGLLLRGESARMPEKIGAKILSGVDVGKVARALIDQAEVVADGTRTTKDARFDSAAIKATAWP